MGSGGLLQLVAFGAQDIYLTSNPQITYWKLIFRRYTNFSMECISQQFNGAPDFGRKVSCVLSRNGDLIHKVYLLATLPDITVPPGESFRWLNWVGYVLLRNVEFTIGGQRIDKHYGEWLYIWSELSCKPGHAMGLANLVGNVPALTRVFTNSGATDAVVPGTTLYVPLQFFFCQSPGLALPLIALQYHESRIDMEFRPLSECCWTSGFTPSGSMTAELLVDFVYLDTEERKRFAQVSHEYLVPQLQFTGDETATGVNTSIKINFNHPTKELIWVVQPTTFTESVAGGGPAYGRQWFNFTTEADTTPLSGVPTPYMGGGMAGNGGLAGDWTLSNLWANSNLLDDLLNTGKNPVAMAKLQLNGHDRFQEREGKYFNYVVPLCAHENVPPCGINCYSFALRPEEHQASGTLNFSRIDTATLKLTLEPETFAGGRDARIKIFAVSYNILRIMSGMAGLAYSS